MTSEAETTSVQLRPVTANDRFGRLIERRDGVDFPFYNGVPIELSVGKWILVWASVAVGFLALIFIPQPNNLVAILPRALFVVIPLAVLALVAGRHWSAIFRRVRLVDVGNMFFFAALNIVLTFAIGGLVSLFFPVAPNTTIAGAGAAGWPTRSPSTSAAASSSSVKRSSSCCRSSPSCTSSSPRPASRARRRSSSRGSSRRSGSVPRTCPPTTGTVVQAIVVIGSARIALTLAFIRTKNLWVSAGAHIINDWVFITVAVISAAAVAS